MKFEETREECLPYLLTSAKKENKVRRGTFKLQKSYIERTTFTKNKKDLVP